MWIDCFFLQISGHFLRSRKWPCRIVSTAIVYNLFYRFLFSWSCLICIHLPQLPRVSPLSELFNVYRNLMLFAHKWTNRNPQATLCSASLPPPLARCLRSLPSTANLRAICFAKTFKQRSCVRLSTCIDFIFVTAPLIQSCESNIMVRVWVCR